VAHSDERDAAAAPPAAPDLAPVNASWTATAAPGGGLGGLLTRLLLRLLRPQLEAQRAFNADQVRLDNALAAHVDARFAATHGHYDRLLGDAGRRLDEVDERHAQLAQELVAHVQDLARRIDLVLAEADRGRPALEHAIADLKARVARLEEALKPPAR
jgi:hypothetical protein